jgi:hypothetical protein
MQVSRSPTSMLQNPQYPRPGLCLIFQKLGEHKVAQPLDKDSYGLPRTMIPKGHQLRLRWGDSLVH